MRNEKGQFVKGYNPSPKTQFKKGQFLGEKHPMWKGGRERMKIGYILCYAPNHPRAYRNKVYEHILVAEKKIGRLLKEGECVHHINRIKHDNRPENIMVFESNAKHISETNIKENHWKYRKDVEDSVLIRKYFDENKKMKDISAELGVNYRLVVSRLRKYKNDRKHFSINSIP